MKCEADDICGAYLQSQPRCPHSARCHGRCHRRPSGPGRRPAPRQPSRTSGSPGRRHTCTDGTNALNARQPPLSAPPYPELLLEALAGPLPVPLPPRSALPAPGAASVPAPAPSRPLTRGAAAAAHAPEGAPHPHFRPAPPPPRPPPSRRAPIGRQPRGRPAPARYWPIPPSVLLKSPPSGRIGPGRWRRGTSG